ncbi:phage tail tube protein [Streptomyces sp. NPDC002519]
MSDLISDGNTKVAFATSIASITAPTAAELTAATDWTSRLTPDGLKTDPSTADVDTSSLASTFTTNQPGRRSYTVELTFKRGSTPTEDNPYSTLVYGATGFIIVRRGVSYTTAFATGDKVEVYPVAAGEPQNIAPAANEVSKFMSPLKVTSDPATRATVA